MANNEFADSDVGERRQQSFASDPATVRHARRFVSESLRLNSATDATCDTFALITSELITNFVEHGDGSAVEVSIISSPTGWELNVIGASSITIDNPVLHPDSWTIAAGGQSTGRGLGIVRSLCDDITVSTVDSSIRIRCRQTR